MMLFRTPVINNFLVSDLTIKRTRAVLKSKLFLLVISWYMYRKLEENVSITVNVIHERKRDRERMHMNKMIIFIIEFILLSYLIYL